jgi:hypothetical protein
MQRMASMFLFDDPSQPLDSTSFMLAGLRQNNQPVLEMS